MTDVRDRGEDLAEAQWIAQLLRTWRHHNALTQENLAELCGLSVRAIENYESGRRVPNTQARRSLARGMKVDESLFRAPALNEVAAWLAGGAGSLAVAVEPLSSAKRVEALLRPPVEMIHIDMSALPDAMMGQGAEIEEAAVDLLNLWEDIPPTDRGEFVRDLLGLLSNMVRSGFQVYGGRVSGSAKLGPMGKIPWRQSVMVARPIADPIRYAVIVPDHAR